MSNSHNIPASETCTGSAMRSTSASRTFWLAGDFGSLWIYLAAPILGGVLGVLLFERVNRASPP